jgi:predicted outer membrane protein
MTIVRAMGVAAVCLLTNANGFLCAAEKKLTTEGALAKAIDGNTWAKQMADKTVNKAQSEDVRKLARQFAKDHEKILKDLEELAKDKKLAVVSGVTDEQKEQAVALAKLTGRDFDKRYGDLDGHFTSS